MIVCLAILKFFCDIYCIEDIEPTIIIEEITDIPTQQLTSEDFCYNGVLFKL